MTTNRFRFNRSKRARTLAVLITSMLLGGLFSGSAAGNGNPPSVECGQAAYNKYQINDNGSVGTSEVSTPPGLVVTLARVGDSGNTYSYNNTTDEDVDSSNDWEIFRIVEKGGNDPDQVDNSPSQSGTIITASNISHITFCLRVAPDEPPTRPTVTASIICTADPTTGVATYTLDVDAPEGVTTDPANGEVVDNEDTEVTVNWEGEPFTVTAEKTEDCSFTPEEPPNPQAVPAASLAHSCDTGVTASLSNTGDASVTFTISKNGTEVETVEVDGGDSVTKTYSLAEDEAATFSIVAAGLTTVTQSFVHDCVAPPTPTTPTVTPTVTTIPTLVLGEKIVAAAATTQVLGAQLPATGTDPIPMTWLAIAFLALGTILVRMSWPRTVFATSAGENPSHMFGPGRRSSGWAWKLQAGRRSNGFEWGRGLSRRRR